MIRFAVASDHTALAMLYQKIADTNQSASFNWNYEKAVSEINVARTILLLDHQGIQSFITFRETADLIDITALGTDPLFRRRGLVDQLLSELAAYAAQQSKSIGLEVHELNFSAIQLYEKWQFKVIRTRQSYYSDGKNALVMIRANILLK